MMKSLWLGLIGWGFIAWGCDTPSTIDPPEDSFFVKFYGNEGNQEGVDAVLNPDGTITMFGTTEELDKGKQLYLVNILPNGTINWERQYGTEKNEIAKDIELTGDGRLALVADIENTPTEHDILVMTLALDGTVIASDTIKFMNGTTPTDETAHSITQISDGFIVAGSTNKLDLKPVGSGPLNDTRDALFVRFFDDLTLYPSVWKQGYGPGAFDEAIKVIEVSPSQYYLFANTDTPDKNGDINFHVLGLSSTGQGNSANDFFPGKLSGSNEVMSSVAISPIQSGDGYLLAGVSQIPGSSTDVYIVKLKKDLNFNDTDIQFQKGLAVNLGNVSQAKVSAIASSGSGFLILANEKLTGVQNFYLTKIDNGGFPVWGSPVVFGGEKDDRIGSILELPDGSIGIIGTFAIGQDGETKMTFIKVNKEGKFSK